MHARIRPLSTGLALVAAALVAGCSWQYLKPAADAAQTSAARDVDPLATTAEARAHATVATTGDAQTPATPPTPAPSLWASLGEELVFKGESLPQVRRQIAWYEDQRTLLRESSERATPYLHYVMAEIEARGYPADLALLPIVESGYEPTVISRHGAAGLWQFMGGTGRRFGLSRSGWVDERLDITASTTAALDYLGTLAKRFDGDWLLAIAAYNAGWGNVERAIARNRRAGRPTHVWALPLRGETHALVARMVALSEIYRDPESHGLELPAVPDEPFFAEVTLSHPTDLREFARRSGIAEHTFRQLNPGIRAWHTGPTQGQQILVPAHLASVALSMAEQMPSSPPPRLSSPAPAASVRGTVAADGTRYTVQSGDSLWLIARRFDTTVDALLALNGLTRNATLDLGQSILVRKPIASSQTSAKLAVRAGSAPAARTALESEAPLPKSKNGEPFRYRVRAGDSLWTIAHKFKVRIKDLLAWNNLEPDPVLQPGQEILLYPTV
jgi:membrane-bound lytic murein transglycosylase D